MKAPCPLRAKSIELSIPSHLAMAGDLTLACGDIRKAAQRQKTATTGSTISSRFLRTAFSSRRLTAISAMFEGLPLRAGRFAFSALGTDCSLVLISSARYLREMRTTQVFSRNQCFKPSRPLTTPGSAFLLTFHFPSV